MGVASSAEGGGMVSAGLDIRVSLSGLMQARLVQAFRLLSLHRSLLYSPPAEA
jgi:hypothetical protein